MKLQFKTNINCNNCIQKVTPYLNALDNVDHWRVDLENTDKILSVEIDDDNEYAVINAIQAAGYSIEKI